MIELRNLTKTFVTNGRRKKVFENLNLTVPAGMSVGLLGRNGAGKSTLLQILAGTQEPTSGEVITDASISWPVGFAGSFHPDLTGAQNTRFLARVYGVDTEEMSRFVEDFAELGSHYHMPFRTYSAGMKGRLAFGTSMAIEFDYYLVDEATAAGDQSFRSKADATFLDRMQNAGSFVVSHSMNQMKALCDVGLVLENGEITYFDDIEDAIAQHEANLKTGPVQQQLRRAPAGLSSGASGAAATGGATPPAQDPEIMKDSRNLPLPNGQYVRLSGPVDTLLAGADTQSTPPDTGTDRGVGALLLCLHSGGGIGGNPETMDLLASQIDAATHDITRGAVVTASASYRLATPGQDVELDDMIEDTVQAIHWAANWLRDTAPQGTRLYLMGASFGALLVLEALRRAPPPLREAIQGLILVHPMVHTGPGGFVNRVMPKGAYADLDPLTHYADPELRAGYRGLLIHGMNDNEIAPLDHARAFADLWPQERFRMVEYPGAAHGFFSRMPMAERTGQEIARFLQEQSD